MIRHCAKAGLLRAYVESAAKSRPLKDKRCALHARKRKGGKLKNIAYSTKNTPGKKTEIDTNKGLTPDCA